MPSSALLFPGQGSHAQGMDEPYRGSPLFERGLELLGRAADAAPDAYQIRLNFAKSLIKTDRKIAARKELEQLARLDEKLPQRQEAVKLLGGL